MKTWMRWNFVRGLDTSWMWPWSVGMATTTVQTFQYRFSLVIDSSDIILQSCIQCNVESNCGIEEHFSSCSCISHKLCHNSWSGAPGALGLLGRPRWWDGDGEKERWTVLQKVNKFYICIGIKTGVFIWALWRTFCSWDLRLHFYLVTLVKFISGTYMFCVFSICFWFAPWQHFYSSEI